MPSLPCTTSTWREPRRSSTRTWIPTRSGWNTPINWLAAPAGFVSGPRMLKIVRTASSLRTAATFFMAPWWAGANMKPMPVAWMHSATSSGVSTRLAPRASSTSALPLEDEALRLPCLAIGTPAAAATNMAVVEILKVWLPSPPVPHMSSRSSGLGVTTGVANSRMTCAAAVISPMVSFFTRSPISRALAICGDISPRISMRIRCSISSWKISRCSMQRVSASVVEIVTMLPS
ncbi:hypothetical protein D9M68_485390 [compost metagenome]